MKTWKCLLCIICLTILCQGNLAAATATPIAPANHSITSEYYAILPASSEQPAYITTATGNANDTPDSAPIPIIAPSNQDLNTGLLFGSRVVITEGTRYWASANDGGSGSYGTIGNRYAPMGADLYVGGFAQVPDNKLTTYQAYNPQSTPIATQWTHDNTDTDWDETWTAIYRDPEDTAPLGWVPARSIAVINGILGDGKTNAAYKNGIKVLNSNEDSTDGILNPSIIDTVLSDPGNTIESVITWQDITKFIDPVPTNDSHVSTREIAYAIEDYANDGNKVALLLDVPGSVFEYMTDIANYGTYVDKVNKAETIITFGSGHKVISAEDYLNTEVDSYHTDIYAALNSLNNTASYDRIILVTDTWQNVDSHMQDVTDFAGKIVVVCPIELNDVYTTALQEIETAFNTKIYLCKLDNQLDYIRTLAGLGLYDSIQTFYYSAQPDAQP